MLFSEYIFFVKISKNLKIKIYKTITLPAVLYGCETMVSYIKGGMKAKGIWEQDPDANIWAQEEWEGGVEKALQWGTSQFVPLTYYSQGD